MTTTVDNPKPRRKRGRPRIGDVRLEIQIPTLLFQQLLSLEKETWRPVTRLAADILFRELIG